MQNCLIFQCDTINKAATNIAKTVAKEHGTITAGGIAMTDVYQTTRNKEKTVAELKTSTKALIDSDIDMLICEVMYFLKFIFQFVSIHKLKKILEVAVSSMALLHSKQRYFIHMLTDFEVQNGNPKGDPNRI